MRNKFLVDSEITHLRITFWATLDDCFFGRKSFLSSAMRKVTKYLTIQLHPLLATLRVHYLPSLLKGCVHIRLTRSAANKKDADKKHGPTDDVVYDVVHDLDLRRR